MKANKNGHIFGTFERQTDRVFCFFFALLASFCFPAIGTRMDFFI